MKNLSYFHIEGMDLAGKTTVSKLLSSKLDSCIVRRNTLQDKSEFQKIVDYLRVTGKLDEYQLGILYCKVLEDDLKNYVYRYCAGFYCVTQVTKLPQCLRKS
jgi:thymidylate kinase